MAVNNRRFVLSFLEKSKYSISFNEEMLCDEQTGEILVKTKDGDIISYDASARFKDHMESFTNTLNAYGFIGNVYNIIPNEKILPSVFKSGENILENPVSVNINAGISRISIDYDCVKINRDGSMSHSLNTNLTANVTFGVGSSDESSEEPIMLDTMTKSIPVSDIDTDIFDITSISGGVPLNTFFVDNINITNNDETDNDTRIIIHSVLVAVAADTTKYVETDASDYIYRKVNNSYISILRYIGKNTAITIPSTIESLPVRELEATAFNHSKVVAVIIPSSVTMIN